MSASRQPSAFDAEVIVAGAGPAGAVAARTLAAAGVDTLLVDRAAFPRNKPCGGGVSARAQKRFPWLDAAIAGIDIHPISILHLEGPDRSVLELTSESPCGILIRRVEFDHALVTAALSSGARLEGKFEITQASRDPDGVTLQSRDGRQLRAPFVVAADGVHSVIAKRLGVNAKWPRESLAIDMMEETPVETLRAVRPDVLWIAYAYNGLDGYSYIFPKTRHVNVGIGCLMSFYDEHVDAHPYDMQREFVQSLVNDGALVGSSDRKMFTPFLIPVGGPLENAANGRVLFAGDAGGFVNGFTAEGIYYAMVSGELAGSALATAKGATRRDLRAAANVGAINRDYSKRWRAEIGSELRDSVRIQRYLFGNHDRVTRFVKGGRSPEMAPLVDLMLAYMRGDLSYAALRRRIILKFPATMVRMVAARM